MIRGKQFLKGFVFLLLLAVVVNSTGDIFGVVISRNALCWRGFKKEKRVNRKHNYILFTSLFN